MVNGPEGKLAGGPPTRGERAMKYICLGYIEPGKFQGMTEEEQQAMLDQCFEYDDHLRANENFIGGEALQPPETALTLYWKNGKAATVDGPYTETKEQIGGILVLEARDLNHAIQLISQHPGVKYGPWEIRPAADLSEMMKASEQRRRKHTTL
jgi:hypothetical protein